jgi:YbbR domain-containing protein
MITRLRHLVFDHAPLKLVSFIIAVLMWYGVSHEPVSEVSLRVPVEFSHPPNDLDYISDVAPQAQLRLRGPARLLRDLAQETVHVVVDLRGAAPGEHTYDLTSNQVQVPHDIEVMEVTPTRLRLVFDNIETRQIAVKPRIVGAPLPGSRIAQVISEPAMVVVNGPARHVAAMDGAFTDAVDVTGVTGKASFDTRVYLPDPLVHLTGPSSIHVTVTTEKSSSKAGAP